MKAMDFILQVRADLQEKSEHWKDEELLIKLQRAYIALQFDLPFFITTKTIDIKNGKTEYYLDFVAIKNISLTINLSKYIYLDIENFYLYLNDKTYTFNEERLLINPIPLQDTTATLVYKHQKELGSLTCEVELPMLYHKALRLLFLSEIHEKPTRNTKERNLSVHYMKLYEVEKNKLKVEKKTRVTKVTSNYQKV